MSASQSENFDDQTPPTFPTGAGRLAVKSGSFTTNGSSWSQSSPNAGQLGTDGVFWGKGTLDGDGIGTLFSMFFYLTSVSESYLGLFPATRVTGTVVDTNDQGFEVQIKQGSSDVPFIGIGLFAKTAGGIHTAIGSPISVALSAAVPYQLYITCVDGTDGGGDFTQVSVFLINADNNYGLQSDGSWQSFGGSGPSELPHAAACISQKVLKATYNFTAASTFFSAEMYDFPANQAILFDDISNADYAAVPGPPTGFTVTGGSPTTTAVFDADDRDPFYNIYQASTLGGTYTKILTETNLQAQTTSLTPGSTYYFKIAHSNVFGVGTLSSAVSYVVPGGGGGGAAAAGVLVAEMMLLNLL